MQESEANIESSADSQLISGMQHSLLRENVRAKKRKSIGVDEDNNLRSDTVSQNGDDNQQIQSGNTNLSSQNNSGDITGKKRSTVIQTDDSVVTEPPKKKHRVSNSSSNNKDDNVNKLTVQQLQRIQEEEQVAFQSQMISEGIIPQPHIMASIQRYDIHQFDNIDSDSHNYNFGQQHNNNNNNNDRNNNSNRRNINNSSANLHAGNSAGG